MEGNVSEWICGTCQGGTVVTSGNNPIFSHPEMMEHWKTVHHIEPKGLQCNKRMTLHMDCVDRHITSYEVTFPTHPDIKLYHNASIEREAAKRRRLAKEAKAAQGAKV